MASIAYDVLNHRILDALLEPMSIDERTLAARHMDHIRRKSRTDLLYTMFIFDRGYASKKLISYIENEIHARYLFRLRSKFNLEIDAVPLPTFYLNILLGININLAYAQYGDNRI